jgi:dimeric dUTPase (all-alpha-NTP-PPase superfamily)
MKAEILDMFQLQEDLNKKINSNWKEERTKEDFVRATWIECAELVDSLPWKWWKKQEPDMENVQIEVVDIWHFIMSYILLDYENISDVIDSMEVSYFFKGINEDFHNIEISGEHINHYLGETDRYKKLIFLAERVAEGFLKNNGIEGSFFFGLLVKNTISFKNLYLLYIGKNVLNHIRQEMGYNKGTYRKNIEGLEDNQYLFKIVKEVNNKGELEQKIRETFEKLHQEVKK